jgi:hypothetical protein
MCLKRIEANDVLVSLRFLVEEMTPTGNSQSLGFPAHHYASLLAGLIHKSNNIITVLSGHSGLLLLESNLSEEILRPIRRMSRAAETLSRYIDEAGVVSKATALVLEPIVFSDFFETLTRPSGLKTQKRCDNNVTIRGDRRKLKDIFEQILQNADEAKATSEIVTAAKEASAVRLSFRDNGHGIKSGVMPRVFDPFFTTRTQRDQFGLGLFRAMVKRTPKFWFAFLLPESRLREPQWVKAHPNAHFCGGPQFILSSFSRSTRVTSSIERQLMTSSRVSQPFRAISTPNQRSCKPRTECASGLIAQRTP